MVEHGERVLLSIFAVIRLAIFLQSVVAAVVVQHHLRYPMVAGCALAVVMIEGVFVVGRSYRRGALDSYGLVALDLVTLVAALWCVNFALEPEADPYSDLFLYPYSVASMLFVGLTMRRPAEAVFLPLLVAGNYIAIVVGHAGHEGPLLPNCMTYWLWSVVAWGLAQWYRRLGAELDAARDQVVAREVELARERAHVLSSVFLHNRTLQVMTAALREGIADEPTRNRLHAATAELREFIEHGPERGPHDLVAALNDEVRRQIEAGLHVELHAAGLVGRTPPAKGCVEAVTNAVSAALNNVGTHAGVAAAVVRAVSDDEGVEVTVLDGGNGFDPDRVRYGLGIPLSIFAPAREVGGWASIESRPGDGTLVRVWVPLRSPESRTRQGVSADSE